MLRSAMQVLTSVMFQGRDMTTGAFERWALPYYRQLPNIGLVLYSLPYVPVSSRKILLAFTRIRQKVSIDTRFSRRYKRELQNAVTFTIGTPTSRSTHTFTLQELMTGIEQHLSDPITMSFLSTLIRSAPYHDYLSVMETKEETLWKEFQAALAPAWNQPLDYTAIFSSSPRDRFVRLAHNLPLNPLVHQQLHNAFCVSKSLLNGLILYPQTSTKTIGQAAQALNTQFLGPGDDELISMREIISLEDCERFYHRTGVHARGHTEMRSAWKYNDLKPRVYYAQGPDCYAVSKYIQPVFNVILDCFEVVHRHNRFENPLGQMQDPEDRLSIYDYSSFTSSLEEIKAFTRALATFYSGIKVVLVDTVEGPILKDLGDLLLDYTLVCNEAADFDVAKVLQLGESLVLRHTCGMLGVPGNISSCTLLHGLHLVVILGDAYLGRCVGDDALAIVLKGADDENWRAFVDMVNNLGSVAVEKFEHWDVADEPDISGWCYTKAPIARMESAILRGISLTWPGVHDLIPLRDQYHTTRPVTARQRCKNFIAQWSRLLTKIHILGIELTPDNTQLLSSFQNQTFRTLGLKQGGLVTSPLFPGKLMCPKRLQQHEFALDWKKVTLDFIRLDHDIVTLPRWVVFGENPVLHVGAQFHAGGSKLLSLLVKLGYVEREVVMDTYDLRRYTSDAFLEKLITLDYAFCYEYRVLATCPEWVNDISNLELMSPHERIHNYQW